MLDFSLVGVAKAGTTSLAEMFLQHPDLDRTVPKELPLFETETAAHTIRQRLEEALTLDGRPTVECSPQTSFYPGAFGRLKRFSPNVKPIIMLRHPVDRFVSQWRFWTERGKESRSLMEVIEYERATNGHLIHPEHSYVRRGDYGRILTEMDTLFPDYFILTLEATHEMLPDLWHFMGVDSPLLDFPKLNPTAEVDLNSDEVEALYDLLQEPGDVWESHLPPV